MMNHFELESQLNTLLHTSDIRDYCPNGLQVQGCSQVKKVVTGVTASQALIDQAIAMNADAILVHHGYFWKNEPYEITGMKYQRIAKLIKNDINLYAYHLPIDVHEFLGNNAELGRILGCSTMAPLESVAPKGVVFKGQLGSPKTLSEVADGLAIRLGRIPLVEGPSDAPITTLAWCTGGGQGFIEQAAQADADVFITGEVSEQTIHIAREMGVHFIAAGHHATERYGVKAVGEYIADNWGLDVTFVDVPNPA